METAEPDVTVIECDCLDEHGEPDPECPFCDGVGLVTEDAADPDAA